MTTDGELSIKRTRRDLRLFRLFLLYLSENLTLTYEDSRVFILEMTRLLKLVTSVFPSFLTKHDYQMRITL